MRPTLLSLCALLALPSSMVSGSSPGGAVGVARLEAPPESTGTILKVVASLPVRAIPVAPGEPVRKDTLLVEMDVRQLDRQIDEARARLFPELT